MKLDSIAGYCLSLSPKLSGVMPSSDVNTSCLGKLLGTLVGRGSCSASARAAGGGRGLSTIWAMVITPHQSNQELPNLLS